MGRSKLLNREHESLLGYLLFLDLYKHGAEFLNCSFMNLFEKAEH